MECRRVQNLDPTSGEAYYMNYNNGSSQWTRPRWLRRIDEDVTLPWGVAYKPGDSSGVPQFYHAETATWSEDKPDGYLLCDVCRYYLAYRQCCGQGCDGTRGWAVHTPHLALSVHTTTPDYMQMWDVHVHTHSSTVSDR